MSIDIARLKIAIVYDWIDKWGGVERVLLTFHEMFPKAIFYTSYFDGKNASWAKDFTIRTSFIQKLPNIFKRSRIASLPFYPYAFESFNFNDYDLIISITSSFAKAIITQPNTLHICYLLTPARFLWSHINEYFSSSFAKKLVNPYLNDLKKWDKIASQRPDKIISISQTVVERCKKYYGRESEVIYPPFDKEYWDKINSKPQLKTQNYYLVVSRLERYKKVDLVIKTFNQLQNLNLIIVGKGTEENKLKQIAGKNIQFVKDLSDEELSCLYSQAQALIMPQEEDFGYVALEAQFFGCPVIAYNKGGATETVIDGETGLFFNKQSVDSLTDALERFDKISYNLRENTVKFGWKNTEKFNKDRFIENFQRTIKSKL